MTVKAIIMYEVVDSDTDSILLTREQALALTGGAEGRVQGATMVRWDTGATVAPREHPNRAVHVTHADLDALKSLLETP